MVRAESSGRVEQSLLCNFFSVRIGQAVGCWWAQRSNLESIIRLLESALAERGTVSSTPASAHPTDQPRRPACFDDTWQANRFFLCASGERAQVWVFSKPIGLPPSKYEPTKTNLSDNYSSVSEYRTCEVGMFLSSLG